MMGFGMIFGLAILVGTVMLIVWGAKGFSGATGAADAGSQPAANQSPRETLQTRYARGEIAREQYLQMLDDLK